MATSRIVAIAAAGVLLGALTAEAQQVSEKSNRDWKVITAEEIQSAHVTTAYQAIEKLHPDYLRRVSRVHSLGGGRMATGTSARGAAANSDAAQSTNEAYASAEQEQRTTAVFVDGTDMGGAEELQKIQANLVDEIRYLNGADAEGKYGPRFSAGVIELKLKHH